MCIVIGYQDWNHQGMLCGQPASGKTCGGIRKDPRRLQGRWPMDIRGRRTRQVFQPNCGLTRLLRACRLHGVSCRQEASALDGGTHLLTSFNSFHPLLTLRGSRWGGSCFYAIFHYNKKYLIIIFGYRYSEPF